MYTHIYIHINITLFHRIKKKDYLLWSALLMGIERIPGIFLYAFPTLFTLQDHTPESSLAKSQNLQNEPLYNDFLLELFEVFF